ncbi:hypothetical protein LLEC1_02917 [Akanthomyces lecanii]|uniref:Uncharacterized protein n=1 Tax=Cordyceps confragosa TaxID=2714763 RepID=A0A179ILN2_CORDF|nr:hypothetical protein LLEC1_02917 [Akanthomyces lecanii]
MMNSDAVHGMDATKSELQELWPEPGICRNTWISSHRIAYNDEPPSDDSSTDVLEFEMAEHQFLGNQITPIDDKGNKFQASKVPILFLGSGSNIQPLYYGQISALAGDFYGTTNPISDGIDEDDRHKRFLDAFNTLANNPQDQPQDARALIKYLQLEVDEVGRAHREKRDPSTIYKGGEVVSNVTLQMMTSSRKKANFLSYAKLALINWDHFGDDARTSYTTGHKAAIELAARGGRAKDALFKAYAMNAFADHFLQDLFSAGHLRTPRRLLHGPTTLADKCAQYMHDEDCALGLSVTNKKGEHWVAYGDRRLLDRVNEDNLKRCLAAVHASSMEVYTAWNTKKALPVSEFGAWNTIPTKTSATATSQKLPPLFLLGPSGLYKDLKRRTDIDDRSKWRHDTNWTTPTTALALVRSKRWNYPMTF